jgi:hypothetical protein
MKFLSYFVLAGSMSLGALTRLNAELIDLLVPAYANPCCDGGPNMWNQLIATASNPNRNYEVHAIFNPASGPGVSRDPNYVNSAGAGPLANFLNAGGIAHGYVPTTFGTRAMTAVKADIDAYLTGHYSGFVNGIFFDEMSNDLARVGYYQELNAYVKSLKAGARTFGNPGTVFTNNPSGQSTFNQSDYINSLDTIMTFESTGSNYANNYTSFPYVENLDRLKIAHIVHTQATWNPNLLQLASSRGSGFLYITDDIFVNQITDNPYDSLASYWPALTNDLQIHNAAVPEPSSILLISICLLGLTSRRCNRVA